MPAKHTWEQRIERAEELAQGMPYAQDVLGFYTEVLKWQRDLSNLITAASVNQGLTGYFEHDHSLFVNSFDSLLEIVRLLRLSNWIRREMTGRRCLLIIGMTSLILNRVSSRVPAYSRILNS
jgi:hypothetical protein